MGLFRKALDDIDPGWEDALMGSSPAGSSPSFGRLPAQGPLQNESERSIYVSQQGTAAVEITEAQFIMHTNAIIARFLKRLHRKAFAYTHPVDEYTPQPGNVAASLQTVTPLELTRTWDIPERIESILYSFPTGTTLAVAKLGDRYIVLYSGTATATQTTAVLQGLGMVLSQDDDRFLYVVPAPSGSIHLELMGYADPVFGDA